MRMTWGEFKARVQEQGVEDATVLAYIDMAFDCNDIVVGFDLRSGVCIYDSYGGKEDDDA